MEPFEIFIAYVSWESGGKRRPVLLLAIDEGYAKIFRITSQYTNKSDLIQTRYFPILDWQLAGLNKLSYIDTNASVDVPMSEISLPLIGKLSMNDRYRLIEFLAK
jgi:hypothetical protein